MLTVSRSSATMALGCGAYSALLVPEEERTALTGQTACGGGGGRRSVRPACLAGRWCVGAGRAQQQYLPAAHVGQLLLEEGLCAGLDGLGHLDGHACALDVLVLHRHVEGGSCGVVHLGGRGGMLVVDAPEGMARGDGQRPTAASSRDGPAKVAAAPGWVCLLQDGSTKETAQLAQLLHHEACTCTALTYLGGGTIARGLRKL
jgi:hypothetical protein